MSTDTGSEPGRKSCDYQSGPQARVGSGLLCQGPHLLQGLHGEVDAAASSGQRQVLLGHGLHLLHNNVCLLHFPGDLGSFPL